MFYFCIQKSNLVSYFLYLVSCTLFSFSLLALCENFSQNFFSMKTIYSATIFHVHDVETSILYYTGVLGFKVDFRYKDLAGMEYDSVLIYLSGPKQDMKKAIGEGSIYIFCDKVDQYFKDISSRGAILEITLEDRDYGMRDFAVKDPDGNIITFGMQMAN